MTERLTHCDLAIMPSGNTITYIEPYVKLCRIIMRELAMTEGPAIGTINWDSAGFELYSKYRIIAADTKPLIKKKESKCHHIE